MNDKIEQALRRLKESKKVVYDAETSGLSWLRNHTVGHVLTFGPAPTDSYYIPVRHFGGGNFNGNFIHIPQTATDWKGDVHPVEKEIIRELDRSDMEVVFHNGAFDLKFLYRLGLRFAAKRYEDTMLNEVLLDEWSPSVSLDASCKRRKVPQKVATIYDYIAKTVPESKGIAKNAMAWFWKLSGDDPQVVEYAEQDGCSTWCLQAAQTPELHLQNLQLVHSVECRVIPVLARLMTRGVRVDVDRLRQVKEIVEDRKKKAREALPQDFNTRAPTQVRALMEKNGHIDWPMTAPTKAFKNGQPSFTEQWLIKSDIGKAIVDLRKLENLENSFLNPMLETHLFEGRVYPEYHQMRGDEYGTVTGRLSSSNPNLQQVSKRNKDLGQLHRSIFVPDDGMDWGSADYKQMEPTLLAYYSRCKVLMEGFHADPPLDPHQAVADSMGMSDNREIAKRINQTLITGGGKGVLVSKYGVDPDKVGEYWDKYFEAMPEIKILQRQASFKMAQRGYVLSLLGRRCRLNDPKKNYVGLNRLLQTGNADCLKLKLCEIDDFLRSEGDDKCNLLTNVHDAFDFQFKPEYKRVYDEALKIMTSFGPSDVIELDVPVRVDHKEGASWASATW